MAVPNGIWDKPGPLSAGERERVRLHPYYTERVLERSGALAPLALLEVMPDAAAFATIDKPTPLVAASESPPEQREITEAMAGVLDARSALVAGGI